MKLKRVVALSLVFCMVISSALSENLWNGIGEWINDATNNVGNWAGQAWEDTSEWADQAWQDTSAWANQAWLDTSELANQAWLDTSAWVDQAWKDSVEWLTQAWNDSATWVSQAWTDSSTWISTNWNHFGIWITTTLTQSPYSWVNDMVVRDGILAYDGFSNIRSFLAQKPSEKQVRAKYDELLSELSLLEDDKDILWNMMQDWANEKSLSFLQVAEIALPFVQKLIIQGSTAIGDDAIFSGPVVAQYLITILNSIKLDSIDIANEWIKILGTTLDGMTRPVVIGDMEQNTLVTDDGYYIENFTFGDGRYQIILIAAMKDTDSVYPQMRGKTLSELAEFYMQQITDEHEEPCEDIGGFKTSRLSFASDVAGTPVAGSLTAVWADNHNYLFFFVTNEKLVNDEYSDWIESIAISSDSNVSFAVDMESDGAFYGINQTAQKYTINRIFDEAKFLSPKAGHGWAAERGNNLIDNIKGFIKGEHATVIGDNNVKDGADRMITASDGSTLFIQSKYYQTAASGIAACFKDGKFRYIDSDGNPMAIEVPADQYDEALQYMKNRISNGEVPGVDPSETSRAIEIVRKGSLTFQQAKHIAKAGTVESILYDSVHACVSAGTSMGLSAAVDFALNLWDGQPIETAIKSSIFQGLQTGGTSFLISVLSSQLSKTGLNTAMIPASRVIVHALGPKVSAVIVNAFRPAGNAIYGAAAMQSAAKLLRGNTITAMVSFVVLSTGDIADIIQGKISWKQLAKNTSTTAAGILGGSLGYLGGAAIGTAILPGAGTVVEIIFSVAAGWGASEGVDALADMIADDDAEEMIAIIEQDFASIAEEYFLTQEEVDEAIINLQTLLTAKMLKKMYQYSDYNEFARQLIEMSIDPVVAKRTYVGLPSEEEYADYVIDTLNEIYSEIQTDVETEVQ